MIFMFCTLCWLLPCSVSALFLSIFQRKLLPSFYFMSATFSSFDFSVLLFFSGFFGTNLGHFVIFHVYVVIFLLQFITSRLPETNHLREHTSVSFRRNRYLVTHLLFSISVIHSKHKSLWSKNACNLDLKRFLGGRGDIRVVGYRLIERLLHHGNIGQCSFMECNSYHSCE